MFNYVAHAQESLIIQTDLPCRQTGASLLTLFLIRGFGQMVDSHQRDKARAAALSVVSNLLLTLSKLFVGILMQSVSVISEAVHSGIDLMASMVAFASIKKSARPPDAEHRYGHGKIESLAGLIEALLIFGATSYILFESFKKIQSGRTAIEDLELGTAVMGISALANAVVSSYLFRVARASDSIALEADAIHLRTDVYTSAGVFAALIAIKLTGLSILDPIIAIAVAMLILRAAYTLSKTALGQILDATLPKHEETLIQQVLDEKAGLFVQYHNLRTRKSGNTRHVDLHLVVPRRASVHSGHDVGHQIARAIEEILPNTQILVHVEPCNNQCDQCHLNCLSGFII
jgi:cation diffusion facilitator family transporter